MLALPEFSQQDYRLFPSRQDTRAAAADFYGMTYIPDTLPPALAPRQLHLLLNGACPMRCNRFGACYGPAYDRRGEVSADQWLESFRSFWVPQGVQLVTISGGEPMLRPDLEDLVVGLRELGILVTLSTLGRGRRHDKLVNRPRLLAALHNVGVPMHGHTAKAHGRYMVTAAGQPAHQSWHDSLEIVQVVSGLGYNLMVDIRSVVTPLTWWSLLWLPEVLCATEGVNLDYAEWTVYEPNFRSGPRQNAPNRAAVELPPGAFEQFCREAFRRMARQRQLLMFKSQSVSRAGGKYCFADPDGNVTLELATAEGGLQVVRLGHISRPDELTENFNRIIAMVPLAA